MKVVDVAAAVMLRPDGRFLLGRRAPGTFYAGYWEFPGGKVEAGETPRAALDRELHEELGIEVLEAYPWIAREFAYEHAHVRLHFFRVVAWRGELQDRVHTALSWQRAAAADIAPMLPANAPVLSALALPDVYAITHAGAIGGDAQLNALRAALARGLRLVQLREPGLPAAQRARLATEALALCRAHGAKLLVNGDVALASSIGADGVHLPASQLLATSQRPDFPLVAASCHDARELKHAAALGLDFVVLGPVKSTASHPGTPGMGWTGFAALLRDYPLPVFALGGMTAADMTDAWRAAAHGIAAIRAAWDHDS